MYFAERMGLLLEMISCPWLQAMSTKWLVRSSCHWYYSCLG